MNRIRRRTQPVHAAAYTTLGIGLALLVLATLGWIQP